MIAPELDSRLFKIIPRTVKGTFSHKIDMGQMPFSHNNWFRKEIINPVEARIEGLAQEFFRLIIPNQPRTCVAKNPALGTYYTLSEEIPGYRLLPEGEQRNFTSGKYHGLGQIMLLAAFLQDIDLKNSNVCLNYNDQVLKIDGDWCFASVQYPMSYKNETMPLTPELIDKLPYPHNFYTHNWLDIIMVERRKPSNYIVDAVQLSTAPRFRTEINQAMLKILLTPDSYMRKFVDAFIPVGTTADTYIDFLHERREQLKACALQNASFQAYISTWIASDVADAHFLHMRHFTVNDNYAVVSASDYSTLKSEFDALHDKFFPKRALIEKLSVYQLAFFKRIEHATTLEDAADEGDVPTPLHKISFV